MTRRNHQVVRVILFCFCYLATVNAVAAAATDDDDAMASTVSGVPPISSMT